MRRASAGSALRAAFALTTRRRGLLCRLLTVGAGLALGDGALLAAVRLGEAERLSGFAFFAAFFAARLGAFRVVLAVLLDARFLDDLPGRDARLEDEFDGLAERRAAARGELRFGRLALLPVGRFLAMAV